MKSFFRYAYILLLVIVSCSKQQESEVLIAHFSRTEDIIALNSDYDLPFQVSSNLGPFENYDFSRNKYKAVTESGDPSIVEVIDCGTVRGVGNGRTMVNVDGRFSGKGEGASIEECSLICKYLGLYDAINLDGGGSSSLWTPSTGVINHPCDNKKWDHEGERKDPTIFVAK